MERKAEEETRANPEAKQVGKKPYVSPELTEYGGVEKLTRTGGASGADGARMGMTCL